MHTHAPHPLTHTCHTHVGTYAHTNIHTHIYTHIHTYMHARIHATSKMWRISPILIWHFVVKFILMFNLIFTSFILIKCLFNFTYYSLCFTLLVSYICHIKTSKMRDHWQKMNVRFTSFFPAGGTVWSWG